MSFSYDDGGRRTRTTWPGGYADYQYNARDWVTAVLNRTTGGGTQYLARYYYQDGSLWDHAGNPLKKTEDWGAGDQPTTFRYDHVYRLTEETKRNVDLSVVFSRTYGYDQVGNRTGMTADGVGYTYSYDDHDKLTGVSGGGQSASMGYDLNGNMTSVSGTVFGSKTLVYDDENRPTSISYSGGADTFLYNALGQRMRAVLSGATRRYVYNGERVLEETDDAGSMTGRYTTESGRYYAPLWHIQRADGTSRFPLYDGIGTARRLVTSAGLKTDAYSLDAFGRAFAPPTQPTPNPYRFGLPAGRMVGGAWGYITDTPGSGLLQLGARFYWPEVGRFVQQDPVREGANWYTYAEGNPLVSVDPSGMTLHFNSAGFGCCLDALGVGGVGGGLLAICSTCGALAATVETGIGAILAIPACAECAAGASTTVLYCLFANLYDVPPHHPLKPLPPVPPLPQPGMTVPRRGPGGIPIPGKWIYL